MPSPFLFRQRRPWQLLSRSAAAVFGGYALASAAGIFLAGLLPLTRTDAVLAGIQMSFAVYTLAVVWAFAVAAPRLAWFGLLGASALIGGVGALLAWGSA